MEDEEFNELMLAAFESRPLIRPPSNEQIKYILRHVDNLTKQKRFLMAKRLVDDGHRKDFKECAEGVVIPFDKISPLALAHMYDICLTGVEF